MFRAETTLAHGVPVVRVVGNLDHEAVSEFDGVIEALLRESQTSSLVIDLTQSPLVDSSGLGALVKSHRQCQRLGGRMTVAGMNDRVAKLLGVTHLNTLFEVYADLDAGLAAMRRESRAPEA